MQEVLKIQEFGVLIDRYRSLTLSERASAMLVDGHLALETAEKIVREMGEHRLAKTVFDRLRKNALLIGKMRASEAKTVLLDSDSDFSAVTLQKLAAWSKTAQRLSHGEGVVSAKGGEYIPGSQPLAMAIASMCSVGSYLSIIQLALDELSRLDSEKKAYFTSCVVKLRRCGTLLADCESAAAVSLAVH